MSGHVSRVCSIALVLALLLTACSGQGLYGQYSQYGYSGNTGLWWMQPHCPWGGIGYRVTSQCSSFSCPSLWYGPVTYQCPPATMYSNSLQRCVHLATITNSCPSSH